MLDLGRESVKARRRTVQCTQSLTLMAPESPSWNTLAPADSPFCTQPGGRKDNVRNDVHAH